MRAFGAERILDADTGRVDRKRLGSIVFNDAAARRRLNSIVNFYIAWDMLKILAWHFIIGTAVVVLDVPLLFETGMHRICAETIVVRAELPSG